MLFCATVQAAPIKRDWTVPETRPGSLELLPATDDWSVSVRRVGVRSKEAKFDEMGEVTVYPVVMSPRGVMYFGFERKYAAGTIGRRWLYWDFPTQFRALTSRVKTEAEADFGDHLLDSVILETAPESKIIASGIYQLKWVVNGELIDNGDRFRYTFRKSESDR